MIVATPSPDTSGLVDLLGRVQAANGPDRELDLWIWFRVVNPPETGMLGLTLAEAIAAYPDTLEQVAKWWRDPLPHLTASLDAALALVDRVLPDHDWSVGHLPISDDADHEEHHHFGCLLYAARVSSPRDGMDHGATPALAVIAATLQALIANPHGKDLGT